MNNTAENDFFGFPKIKWLLATTDSWGGQICNILCQIFSEFNIGKIIKIG